VNFIITLAKPEDLHAIKSITESCKYELGFVPRSVLGQAILQEEILVARESDAVIGFIHFRITRRGYCTIAEIGVHPACRGRGLGKALLQSVTEKAGASGITRLRLKCPADLPANGFYAHLGFTRTAMEPGRKRLLAVWEKSVPYVNYPLFFLTLTNHPQAIRTLLQLWQVSSDPRNPFVHLIVSPLFVRPPALNIIQRLKEEYSAKVIFDSGGYQVQMGRIRYEELFIRLLRFYRENPWADWYVLPDHVPASSDTIQEVGFKVRETLDYARLFLDYMPEDFPKKAIGVVHGRTEEQVRHCVEMYTEMGVQYLGFGSFGTSGPKGSVNLISNGSLRMLRLLQTLAQDAHLCFHIFGVGSPGSLSRLEREGIIPTSFDSAGWWKAGAYGNIFFPERAQIHITALPPTRAWSVIVKEKERSGHNCPFCEDVELLQQSRHHRILHNLAVMLDIVDQQREMHLCPNPGYLSTFTII
jgi:N-acetylglutamate synthase-like GNAT family acetyltransferase